MSTLKGNHPDFGIMLLKNRNVILHDTIRSPIKIPIHNRYPHVIGIIQTMVLLAPKPSNV